MPSSHIHDINKALADDNKKGLIIETYPNLRSLKDIQKKIRSIAQKGEHTLILSNNITTYINSESDVFLKDIYTADSFQDGFGYRCSVHKAIKNLSSDVYDEWISKLKLILIEKGEEIFSEPNVWELFCYLLQNKLLTMKVTDFPKMLVIIEPRDASEPALKEALPLFDYAGNNETNSWSELISLVKDKENENKVNKQWWTIWSSCESEDYRDVMYPNNHNRDIGILAPLAQFAGQWGIDKRNNLAVSTRRSGEKDRLENLGRLELEILYKIQNNFSWQFIENNYDFSGAITIYNNKGNPWSTLKRIAYGLPNIIISNVVVKQTMLLEYLLANAYCFATVPILSLSPRIDKNSAYNTTFVLLQRLQHLPYITSDNIKYHLNKVDDINTYDIFGSFRQLVEQFFGKNVARQLRISIQNEWDMQKQTYIDKTYVSLDKEQLNSPIDWLEPVHIKDGNNHFATVIKDHIFQQYWPDKLVPFGGKIFRVDTIDTKLNLITISQDNENKLFDYRVQKSIKINQPKEQWKLIPTLRQEITYADKKLLQESFELSFSIVSSGKIVQSNSMWKRASATIEMKEVFPKRNYKFGRATKISFLDNDGTSLLNDKATIALSAWINEVAITILPEVHPFVVSAPQLLNQDSRPKNKVIDCCIPKLTMPDNTMEKGINGVWIFEDSQTDLGIVRTVFDNFFEIIDLCYDWLQWYLVDARDSENALEKVCLENISYPSQDWFAFGESKSDEALDFYALKSAIETLFNGSRKFTYTERRRRVEKDISNYRLIENDTHQLYVCDICSKQIDIDDTSISLSDGRISCSNCHEVGLTTAKEVETLYDDIVLPFYTKAHNISEFKDLDIKLVDQKQISQQRNIKFIPTSGFDRRAVGLAIHKGYSDSATSISDDKKYTIMIESGHSPESSASTLVHELCHIWQYTYTNYQKMERSYGKLLIEGHAVWSEESFFQYLEQNPYDGFTRDGTEKAKDSLERQKNSSSVYGKGYRMLVDKLGKKKYSAFDWIIKRFSKK